MPLELSAQIRSIRRLRGDETIDDFAKELGVAPKTLSNYELGKRLPDVDFLAEFSRITGADLHQLINLRLQAGGFEPLRPSVQDVRADYRVGDPVDCAAHARQALLSSPDFPRPWCLAVMELAARGEISPSGVDRLIAFIGEQLEGGA